MTKRLPFLLILLCFLWGCHLASYTTPLQQEPLLTSHYKSVKEPLMPSGFGILVEKVGAVDLSPKNSIGEAPVFQLGSSQQLQLKVDVLGTDAPVLGVRFNHHMPNWQSSGLPQPMFIEGNTYEILSEQQTNFALGPLYRSFQLNFPNKNLKFKFSGNYSLEVFNPTTNQVWIRLPFFIHEGIENLSLKVESIYASGTDARIIHQPFSTYKLPDFVQFPITQIEGYFYKNQFWGRPVKADRVDQNIQGELGFHPSRNQAFRADEQVRSVNLLNPRPDNVRILEVDNPDNELKVVLQRDVLGLDANNSRNNRLRSVASFKDDSEYLRTDFYFETPMEWLDQDVYLIGDFTQWAVDERYKMQSDQDPDVPYLKTEVFLKEGIYGYKYVFIDRLNRLDDQAFVNEFSNYTNRYDHFIYYRDPEIDVYRLLQRSSSFVSE